MLDIKFIRDNPQRVAQGAKNKGIIINIEEVLQCDQKKREKIKEIESLKAQHNKINKQVAQSEKNIQTALLQEAKTIKAKIEQAQEQYKKIDEQLNALLAKIPNLPFDDVPVGKDDSENRVKEFGKIKEKPVFDFAVKEHWEIGKALDIIDTERAAKIAGSRFYFLKREGVLLELALINFAFEKLIKKGFIPVIPPVMIKPEMAWAMGYLQQTDDEEAYYLPKDNLYLTATSEQSLGAMHADEILEEKNLPLRYVGFSTCFRREAGSYGKDTKGILRVHQFDKIEMFIFCTPEQSKQEHEFILNTEKELMDELSLHYQVVDICTGDLGVPAAKKYDIEVWLPGQNRYRETHSTSNCTDFQARRLNVRYKDKKGKLHFVHTLNGTAFSMRPIIAILENYQRKDGSVQIPPILQKWTGIQEIKRR